MRRLVRLIVWGVLLLAGLGVALSLVALAVIVVRLVWVNTTPYLIRALDRHPAQLGDVGRPRRR